MQIYCMCSLRITNHHLCKNTMKKYIYYICSTMMMVYYGSITWKAPPMEAPTQWFVCSIVINIKRKMAAAMMAS